MSLRNLSPGAVAALLRPRAACGTSVEGIYRSERTIGGAPFWYALNRRGQVVDVRIVREGDDVTEAVADLVIALRGPAARRRLLKLIRGTLGDLSSPPSLPASRPRRAVPAAPPAR